jgi:hypothetical protein
MCPLLQVVSDFLQHRLVGEGNVLRHLELLGFRLGYSQSALMEYPFAITNLAVDLRDGLRLIKVAEVLTGMWWVLTGMWWVRASLQARLAFVTDIANSSSEGQLEQSTSMQTL